MSAAKNLTHCCDCGSPFTEPVENWDDYFNELDEAAFACATCSAREGYPSEFPSPVPETQP